MDVSISNLVMDYGRVRALDDVSLEIRGGVFGLLGPNGAGKSTLMRILTTLQAPTSGSAQIGPYDVMRVPGQVRQILGYMPQEFGFYRGLSAYEMLDYIGTMKNIPLKGRSQKIERLLDEVNLTSVARRRVGGYSGGMKQRLGIAQALLGDPQLIVVDEPTAGLDPEERIRFRNLLARLAGDRTVILSTHIVADIEASAAAVGVLHKGRLIFTGTTEALAKRANGRVWEMEIMPSEWDRIEHQYRIIASRSVAGMLQVRVLSDTNPDERGTAVRGGIEEGYITVMSDQAASESLRTRSEEAAYA